MQHKNKNSKLLVKHFAKSIRDYREKNFKKSLNKFALENEIERGHLSKIETAKVEPKLSSLWKIAEGFDMPLSKLIEIIEKDLPKDFSLIDK